MNKMNEWLDGQANEQIKRFCSVDDSSDGDSKVIAVSVVFFLQGLQFFCFASENNSFLSPGLNILLNLQRIFNVKL